MFRMEVPPGHKVIQEGKARILYPSDEDGDVPVSFFLALFQTRLTSVLFGLYSQQLSLVEA